MSSKLPLTKFQQNFNKINIRNTLPLPVLLPRDELPAKYYDDNSSHEEQTENHIYFITYLYYLNGKTAMIKELSKQFLLVIIKGFGTAE